MLIDLANTDSVDHSVVGGKAYNLHVLIKAGLPVPPAIVLTCDQVDRNIDVQSYKIELGGFLKPHKKYAVRSSGVGEDSQDKSWAGIFESYLFVDDGNVPNHVVAVMQSVDSERYRMYSSENHAQVSSMAVVVQEMIHADYAGVAFTSSPIERDDRICLVEIVEGVGESMVSGKKTPATIRLNKITGTYRIQQRGQDEISERIIESICEALMPYIKKIEKLYQKPMDIEWAMHDGTVHILQARPITNL